MVGVTDTATGADTPEPTQGFMIDPLTHGVGVHLIFTERGLVPYHACDSVVKSGDGSAKAAFEYDDRPYTASLSYHESGFAPPGDPDVNFDQETVREFDLSVRAVDETGERDITYQISPRWPDMKTTDGGDAPTPDITGVNVKCQGTNEPTDNYPDLLRAAMDALDINTAYFDKIHDYSNIFQFERYVRIRREKTDQVIGTDSPMRRIFRYVDNSSKYRELKEDDRNGVEGYYHHCKIDSASAAALISGHDLGTQIKHYHPDEPREDPSEALYHPKIETSLQTKVNTSAAVPWSDRADLRREVDETLINVLDWAGLPLQPDGETYVGDDYWEPTDSPRSITLIDDPTDDMAEDQYADALATLIGDPDDPDDDGVTATERDAARVLADGGQQDVTALAEQIGRSRSTVYRVLRSLGDVVRNKNGTVAFASDYLAEQFGSLLDSAAAAARKDGETGGSSAWDAWCARYGPEIDELPGETVELNFGAVDPETDMKAVLRKGLKAWLRSGRSERRFLHGVARWVQDGEVCRAGGPIGTMNLPGPHDPRVKALD